MKTRIMIKNLSFGLVTLFLMMLSSTSYSQCAGNEIEATLKNIVTTSNSIEYDVYLKNVSATGNVMRLSGLNGNVRYTAGLFAAGAVVTLTVVDQSNGEGGAFPATNNVLPIFDATKTTMRWTQTILSASGGTGPQPPMPIGVDMKYGRFRVASDLPFALSNYQLYIPLTNAGAITVFSMNVICQNGTTSNSMTAVFSATKGVITHPGSPYNLPVATCATIAAASNLTGESICAGAANGSALITLSAPTPADATVSYTVDGGSTQSASLVSGAFTVSGLTSGDHEVSVTYGGVCDTALSTGTFTIDAGAPLTTNGSATASICEGGSYLWAANGQTYTTAQSGLEYVDGCNTATLNLTVNPATTDGSVTASICDGETYVWAANGQSYTTAQSGVTFVDGCNTATLNLSINPVTTNGDETVVACGSSYTWAVSGQSYNATGVYPFTSGCNTATLTLTLNTAAQIYYADTDGDTFGAGAPIESCTGQPEGTSLNNTDCAPEDSLKWRTANFFVDADGDGYNNGFPAAPVCYGALTPAGYVVVNNGTDCNDDLATTNSNASEIPGNEIDDNCDGTVDEVTPTSYLAPISCGATLTSLSSPIYAYQLASFPEVGTVQAYRFRVTNGGNVRTFDSPTSSFNLTNLAGGAVYGTTYTVAVSVKTGGYFRAYGTDCTVSTPAIPNATNIANPACGSTLVSISATIYCNAAPGASGYKFRVSNGGSVIGTVDTSVNRFSLTSIAGIQFGTTYQIDVLLAYGGQLRPESEYGPACSISTPATPGTSRVTSPSCGSSISSFYTTIYAQQVIGAQGYKFVVTNGAQTREFATPFSRFTLRNLIGGAAPSTTYTIRVDVLYNGSYVQGLVTCDITTTAGATRSTANALDIYEVKAYPNPYADTFKLDVNTSSEGQVGVRVYDMLGREVESREASVDNITNLEIGSQYPSGVYNIIVTQGDNVKTLRVIKR